MNEGTGEKKRIYSIDGKIFVSGDPNLVTDNEFLINKEEDGYKVAIRDNGVLTYLGTSIPSDEELYLNSGYKCRVYLGSSIRDSISDYYYNINNKPTPCYFYLDTTSTSRSNGNKRGVLIDTYNYYIAETSGRYTGITSSIVNDHYLDIYKFINAWIPYVMSLHYVIRSAGSFGIMTFEGEKIIKITPVFFVRLSGVDINYALIDDRPCLDLVSSDNVSSVEVKNYTNKFFYNVNSDILIQHLKTSIILIDPRVDMIYRVSPIYTIDPPEDNGYDYETFKDALFDIKVEPIGEVDFSKIRERYGLPKLDREDYEGENVHILDNTKFLNALNSNMSKIKWYAESQEK